MGLPANALGKFKATTPMTRGNTEWPFANEASNLCWPSGINPMEGGLGKTRWVVERTIAWLNRFRRVRNRYERRADIHEAFLIFGCAMICWKFVWH